jgi:hypothetical protein
MTLAGRLDMDFVMPPPTPGVEGSELALQAYVAPVLSTPASLRLDEPYYLPANAVAIDHPVPSVGANFGDTVEAGDFNADGVMDLAVGAWFEDIGGVNKAGRVYVMWGPDFTAFTAMSPVTPVHLLHFGQGLAVADFDGDGVDDLAVGEGTGGDPPTPGAFGHVYLFRGGPTFPEAPWVTVISVGTAQEAYVFGRLMRTGDVNGDGSPDLVVCAPDATVTGLTKAGRLEVFHGPSYTTGQAIANPQPKVNDFFGSSLGLGDVTGDGIVDVVEGSGRAKVGTLAQAGRLHVFDGPTLALLTTIDNPEPAAGDRFGEGMFVADLDGDGLAEAISSDVKNNFYLVWDTLAGGSIESWPKPPTPNPTVSDSSFGYFFAVADANEDSRLDVIIADPFEGDALACAPLSAGGALYIDLAPYHTTLYRLASPFAACGDEFSWRLITADLDGDGRMEILAGSKTADIGGLSNAGRVVIVRP